MGARDKLAHYLQIPLMQGVLRYAIKCKGLEPNDPIKDLSEGEAFASATLPMVAAYNPEAATLLATNMVMDPKNTPVIDGAQAVLMHSHLLLKILDALVAILV